MTCANNMMASKKKLTKGMLLYVGLCIMISYGMFGMKENDKLKENEKLKENLEQNIQDILTKDIVRDILGEDENFKKVIGNIEKKGGQVKYKGCCCFRGDVFDALVCYKNNTYYVYDLICESLEREGDSVKLANSTSVMSMIFGFRRYMENNSFIINQLNLAIQKQK